MTGSVAATDSQLRCRICGTVAAHQEFVLNESMFETWERFDYFCCAACGCMQIKVIPDDLGPYYPQNYYSLADESGWMLRKAVKAPILRYLGGGRSVLGATLYTLRIRPGDAYWMQAVGIRMAARILDVGCGNGERLIDLARAGFSNLTGIDYFLAADRSISSGLKIQKADIRDIQGEFDLIMFHHSLEHMPDPSGALQHATRLLAPEGTILVRVPVMGKWAWRSYQVDWVQLDPPRHLYTFSEAALQRLAERAALRVTRTIYDSTAFQVEGSERVRQLRERQGRDRSQARAGRMSPRQMRQLAHRLNRAEEGDQVCFLLARASGARASAREHAPAE